MRVLVIMDPIERVNLKKDSTMAMLWAAARRGHTLGYALQDDLFIDQGQAYGQIKPLAVFENSKDYYRLGEAQTERLASYDVILMRKDPPFDMEYIYATYLLELAEQQGARVFNKPAAIRNHNES